MLVTGLLCRSGCDLNRRGYKVIGNWSTQTLETLKVRRVMCALSIRESNLIKKKKPEWVLFTSIINYD